MVKSLMIGVALAAVLAYAGPRTLVAHEGHTHNALGTVSSVEGNHLVVKTTAGKSITVMLDAKTKITRGKDTLDAAALQAGERVSIDYIEENKMMMAQAVKLGTAPAAKKK